jgi:hypothetical protein
MDSTRKKFPEAVAEVERACDAKVPPESVDGGAILLACLGAVPAPEHPSTLVAWLADANPRRAVLSVLRSLYAKPFYDYVEARSIAYPALALWLATADDAAYEEARAAAADVREGATHQARAVVDAVFPSEPWATEDAREYRVEKTADVAIDPVKAAAMLLCANRDLDTARRLLTEVMTRPAGGGAVSMCAAPLLYRFGDDIVDLLLAALRKELVDFHEGIPSLLLRDLAFLPSGLVAEAMSERMGRTVGGKIAEACFNRYPELRRERSEPSWPRERYAVHRSFAVRPVTLEGTLDAWRGYKLRKLSRKKLPAAFAWFALPGVKTVGQALAKWSRYRDGDDWVDISVDDQALTVRGALGRTAIEAGAEELFGLFRVAVDAKLQLLGSMVLYAPAARSGLRLLVTNSAWHHEMGLPELSVVDEAPDIEGIEELLGPTRGG